MPASTGWEYEGVHVVVKGREVGAWLRQGRWCLRNPHELRSPRKLLWDVHRDCGKEMWNLSPLVRVRPETGRSSHRWTATPWRTAPRQVTQNERCQCPTNTRHRQDWPWASRTWCSAHGCDQCVWESKLAQHGNPTAFWSLKAESPRVRPVLLSTAWGSSKAEI